MSKTKKAKKLPLIIIEDDDEDDNDFIVSQKAIDEHEKLKKTTKINVSSVMPWIEKYRPKTIKDIILEPGTQKKIINMIENYDTPNMILTGTPGIGKTTTVQCIASKFYGKYIKDYVLELNASDDRGIKIVQDIIINFCKKKVFINPSDGQRYAEHKMIILDEADNMTPKAQRLINTLMEKYHKTTRFVFTCNNSHDIIEAIQSNCIIFRYHKLSKLNLIGNLEKICDNEKIMYENDALEEIAVYSQGDMRTAINNLQLICNGCDNQITIDGVRLMCDRPQPYIIRDIFNYCVSGDIKNALKTTMDLKTSGYSCSDIMLAMFNTLKLTEQLNFSEETKIKLMDHVAKAAYVVSKGVDTNLQLSGCVAGMACDTYP